MLRFKSLGSGSSGNATLVDATSGGSSGLRLLIDCGLGLKQLLHRLGLAGFTPTDVGAIFITHEHADHIGCALSLSLRHRIPVWMSQGTHDAIGAPDFDGLLHIASDDAAIDLGALQVTPFTVPHDAREPLQLTCTDGSAKLGVLTDLGHATAHVLSHLAACDALLLECNHDTDLLMASSYPAFLKRRVGGLHGHLSNSNAAEIARALNHGGLKHLVAAHLSAQNNRPAAVQALMAEALAWSANDVVVATAHDGCPWLQV